MEKYREERSRYTPSPEYLREKALAAAAAAASTPNKMPKLEPAAPKKPPSAYSLFAQAHREQIRAELGPLGIVDQSRELGRRWGQLGDPERQAYEQQAGDAQAVSRIREFCAHPDPDF